ncbi:MAG TPA: hypothetical protein VNY51_09380 [Candidatus Dormibacteraeota bacterium]|jgi:hypothetical protein|nr:hypothetical protein [Candidatus Dormibacteraeota bacterium]
MGHTAAANTPTPHPSHKPNYAITAKDVGQIEQRFLKSLKATGEYAALLIVVSVIVVSTIRLISANSKQVFSVTGEQTHSR